MNNRGSQAISESLFLFWRLILIAMLTLFIALTVGVAFSSLQDVRGMESSILYSKITDCLQTDGIVGGDFALDSCFLNDSELYVMANVTSFNGKYSTERIAGDPSMKVWCDSSLVKQNEGKKYPYCMSQKSYTLVSYDGKIERGTMEISIAIKKYGDNL